MLTSVQNTFHLPNARCSLCFLVHDSYKSIKVILLDHDVGTAFSLLICCRINVFLICMLVVKIVEYNLRIISKPERNCKSVISAILQDLCTFAI